MLFNIGWDGTSHRRESWKQFKRRVARILCLTNLAKFDYSLYIYIFMSVNKTNVCMSYIVTQLRLKKIVVGKIFLKLSTQFDLFLYSIN